MAWTQSDLDVLEQAIATGALTVRYSDRTVTYRSLNEMVRIRDLIRDDLGLTVVGASVKKLGYAKGIE